METKQLSVGGHVGAEWGTQNEGLLLVLQCQARTHLRGEQVSYFSFQGKWADFAITVISDSGLHDEKFSTPSP